MNADRDTPPTRQAATLSSFLERPRFSWLDPLAERAQSAAGGVLHAGTGTRTLKDWLNGTPLRHRVHPALVIVPLGAWTSALLLDALESRATAAQRAGLRAGADAAVAAGVVAALPSAAAGIADWVDLWDQHRRVGMAHALANTLALGCYGASWALRRSGRRGTAKALAVTGYGIVSLGGALGGELVYTLGVNAPHTLYPKPPDEWCDVLAGSDLPEGVPVVVEVGRVPALLLRHEGEVLAIQDWCPHAGGPLHEGTFDGAVVECPWHGSRFCMRDGAPLQGPAATPARTFAVREQGGRVLIRPSFEGQSWPPPPAPPLAAPRQVRRDEADGAAP